MRRKEAKGPFGCGGGTVDGGVGGGNEGGLSADGVGVAIPGLEGVGALTMSTGGIVEGVAQLP